MTKSISERSAKAVEGVMSKDVRDALATIRKAFGPDSVHVLEGADASERPPIRALPSGCLSLDLAMGCGGYPCGRVVEVFGPESAGKSTLALHAVAEAQRQGGLAAFVDVEHALDPTYAKALGVDLSRVMISQPNSGEEALGVAEALVDVPGMRIVVVDSVAALTPKAEIDGDMGDQHMGLHARLMSQALRKLTSGVYRRDVVFMFINQIRMKIGVMFGSPETTTGGNALKFYASIRLDVRRVGAVKDGETVLGNRTRVKVVKNKMAAPFKLAEFDILFGSGISREGDLLDTALDLKVVSKSGAWWSFRDQRLGLGRAAACEALKVDPKLAALVAAETLTAVQEGVRPVGTDGESDE